MKNSKRKFLIIFFTAAFISASVTVMGSTDTSYISSTDTSEFEDGVYIPDSFSWSGGTGRLKGISCRQITITDNQAAATVVFDSSSYDMLKVDGQEYEGIISGDTATFEIPVQLNVNNTIAGRTTRMSQPHWINYVIYIGLEDPQNVSADSGSPAANTYKASNAPQFTGLRYKNSLEVKYAEYFRLHYYENDISVLEIKTGEDIMQYLLAPEGAEIPAGLEKDVRVIQVPVEKAYIASESGLEILDKQNKTDKIAASGIGKETEISFAGEYDAPDFKTLVKTGCRLAIMPSAILNSQEEGEDLASKVDEQLSLLKIPMIIDRSSDENGESAKEEWSHVFDALF